MYELVGRDADDGTTLMIELEVPGEEKEANLQPEPEGELFVLAR